MEFGRETRDTFHSFIYCCTTQELLYDFNNGDLLLSDVIDLIRLHADLRNPDSWIYLSMLTCNGLCKDKSEEYGVVLHRKKSFTESNLRPKNRNWKGTRNVALFTRKRNMRLVPNSSRSRRHILKIGNSVRHRKTGIKTEIKTKEEKQSIRRDPDQLFSPHLNLDDQVMYHAELWGIVDEEIRDGIHHYWIKHLRTGDRVMADSRELVKVEF
jgi:hypothetical protein